MKKILSLICVFAILVTGTMMMTKADSGASITYRFQNTRAGDAQGTVTLTADTAGKYSLYWADDSAALDGWFEIAVMELKAGESADFTFAERVAVPASATKLIAVKDGDTPTVSDAAAVYPIPQSKRFPHAEKDRSYRFGALSDIHIDMQDGGKNPYYINAPKNFALALNVCADRATDFIITAGDQITNATGAALEWLEYQRIIAESDYDRPIYEAIGNHELRYADLCHYDAVCGLEEFIANTGLDGTAEAMERRKPYYEVTEPSTGDHFIFMALEYNYNPAEYDEFSDEQLEWAEGLLKKYADDGHKIFLIEHSGITGYGAGDDHDEPGYAGSLNTEFKNNARFRKLTETYKDVIWLSGHTHVDFQDNVNYSDEGGTACKMFHIPSVANTTRLTRNAFGENEIDRAFFEDTTQGYIVDVYPDATVLCGVNFYHNKAYPAYTYIVDDANAAPSAAAKPAEVPTTDATASPDELKTAKSELSAYYQYASYPEYAALKRAYHTKSGVETALNDFKALRTRTKLTTVYFADSEKMDVVHACLWNSTGDNHIEALPKQKPTYIKTNSYGQHIYAITVDAARYDRIAFSDSDRKRTADIPLTDRSGRVYCPISFQNPRQVPFSAYENDRSYDIAKTSAVYFTDTADWSRTYLYAWASESSARQDNTAAFVRKPTVGRSIFKETVPGDSKGIPDPAGEIPAVTDGFGYYLNSKSDDGKWYVVEYQY